jgi:hypothetical protein
MDCKCGWQNCPQCGVEFNHLVNEGLVNEDDFYKWKQQKERAEVERGRRSKFYAWLHGCRQ